MIPIIYYFSSTDTDDGCALPNNPLSSGECCDVENPCNVDEGDCDIDDECMSGLYCGSHNCPSGFKSSHTCCTGKYG